MEPGGRGRGKFPDTSCFGPHDEEEYGDPAKRPPRQPQAGGKSLSGGGEKFDWPDPRQAPQDTQFCYGLRQQIAVLCDGTVVPCCLDSEGRLALGNLLSQEMDDILASPRARAIQKGFDARRPAEELCRRCGYAVRFNR